MLPVTYCISLPILYTFFLSFNRNNKNNYKVKQNRANKKEREIKGKAKIRKNRKK